MRIGIEGLPLLFHRTGTSTYTHELVHNLRCLQQGDTVILFGRNQKITGSYHSISYSERAANLLYKNYRLPSELAKQNIEIYHSPRDMGLPDPAKLPCPSVMTLHDIILVRMARDYYSRAHAMLYERRLLEKVRNVDHVITPSNFSREDIIAWSGISPDKITAIHNGVSEKFKPVTDDEFLWEVRRRYNLPPRFVLCVGSTEPRKNIRTAIAAFQQLRRGRTDIKLVITGTEYCQVDPQKAFSGQNLEGIQYSGYIEDSDMAAVYGLADVLLFPSLYEGFGLPPLEAMACRTPVVTSNTTSIPEVVGDAAILVDPEKASELAAALEMVLSSDELREDLIRRGAARAAEFSWRRAAEKIRDIYIRVIEERAH